MNRISPGLSLSKARVGFEQYKAAEGLSPNTLVSYSYHLKLFQEYIGDVDVSQVTKQSLRAFLAWLRTECKPIASTAAKLLSPPKNHPQLLDNSLLLLPLGLRRV